MKTFDHIAIIFNPKSTGDAPRIAEDLRDTIDGHYEIIQKKSTLYPTQHAGHATSIARDVAVKYERPLIISVSGDGGYNEVVNGAMRAKNEVKTARPVIAVMAAGNANDHKRVVRGSTPLIRLIKRADIRPLDLISISARASDFRLQRYAHSYIGLGITPEVGHELNRHGKGLFNEIKVILRTLGRFEPFLMTHDGVTRRYDNIVFANINEMAKVVQLDEKPKIRDGKFEVITLRHHSKLRMLGALLSATIKGFRHVPSVTAYDFTLPDKQPVQCDGEIEELPNDCHATIKSHAHAIDSLY